MENCGFGAGGVTDTGGCWLGNSDRSGIWLVEFPNTGKEPVWKEPGFNDSVSNLN